MRHNDIKSGLAVLTLILVCICLPGWVEADAPRPRIAPMADKPSAAVTLVRKDLGERELVSLGTFTAFAYCSCPQCCGQWSGGSTASGTMPEAGRTVAADWSVLPAGTEIYIADLGWRTVEDTGSGIAGGQAGCLYGEPYSGAGVGRAGNGGVCD